MGEGDSSGKVAIDEKNLAEVADSEGLALLPSQMSSAGIASAEAWAEPPSTGGKLHVLRPASSAARESSGLSDEELVLAVRRKDPTLGRHLYRHLIRVIDKTLFRVLGPSERDRDDLVQAVFEEVVRTIHSGKYQMRCSLTSWAATIACHVGLNAIRSRRTERGVFDLHQAVHDEEGPSLASQHPERALAARDELRKLREQLAAMAEGRAEAVLMHDMLGYELAEIAAFSNSSVAAVQSRLVRGRRELLERMNALKSEAPVASEESR
jgi:RNA polymerase sigma-70 factor (ECF subfamily)